MTTIKKTTQHAIATATKKISADSIIKNGNVLNVFDGSWSQQNIAIAGDKIVGIGDYHEAKHIIDATGKYIVPGFIDAHVHIESSNVTPQEMARILLLNGVTSIVTDPHEIANVAGVDGIRFMIKEGEKSQLDTYFMLPSSVPAVSFEHAGAILKAADLKPLYQEKTVIGLAEVMDYPAVFSGEEDMIQKITDALVSGGHVDGHGAGLTAEQVEIYMAAGIRTDHESTTEDEARARMLAGMNVFIREGTITRDTLNVIGAVTPLNSRRFSFCTDDKLISDLMTEGSINYSVKLAIEAGIAPEIAYQMASLNAAEAHQLTEIGAIAAGYQADIVILDNIEKVKIDTVIKRGQVVVVDGERDEALFNQQKATFKSPKIEHQVKKNDLVLPLVTGKVNVIGIQPNHVETDHLHLQVTPDNGKFKTDYQQDIVKMVVVERHHGTGCVGVGLVKGFELKEGAFATTVAHDSHNIVAVGTSDEAILKAIAHVTDIGGGIAMIDGNLSVLADLPLPIAGLLSDQPYEIVNDQLKGLHTAFESISTARGFDPMLTLSFLTLPVIPALKLTDQGYYDFYSAAFIQVEEQK
ncbi:adenine deaminase [Brochothrix thermosphacta]|uniref:adenine deaminase n=1 Tax=Brochothrix thermosphacta TaxID=2756 RepID=UPI0039B06858